MYEMAERYTEKIRRYCSNGGIQVPAGFDRHAASRYAIVQLTDPPKLVARTWFKVADVIYYLNLRTDDTPLRILDFKENQELAHDGGSTLTRIKPFDPS
jgi:hypothetical protein